MRLLKLSFLTAAMVVSAASFAQEQPRSMLGDSFDLKAAVLSPAPLGPPSQFQPPPAAASATSPAVTPTSEAKPAAAASQASAPRRTVSSKPRQKAAVTARKSRSSPLDSYATDTRRQTWPCSGGGICAWSQPR
jgi:hypothetical protein